MPSTVKQGSTNCIYTFTLVLRYFNLLSLYELECKILVKIPNSMLDSALVLGGKKARYWEKKYEFSMWSDLVKNLAKTC